MRPRSAVAVWAAALALGGVAGLVGPALAGGTTTGTPATRSTSPDAGPAPVTPTATPTPVTASPSPSASAGPSSSPSPSPSATPASGPPTRSDLLSVGSFADVSVNVVNSSPEGGPDRSVDATSCVSDDVHTTATLRTVTGHDPVLEGDWTETTTGVVTRQLVAVGDDEEDARESVTRLAVSMQACEEATPGHYVLGAPSTQNYSPTRSATYVGFYPAEQNRSGRAPTGVEPCGGTLLARNGNRFTTVVVAPCLDGAQLATLAETASRRLG